LEIIQQLEDFATYNFIPALVIEGHELMVISGIGEYARRIRELRVEHGWPIISGVAPKDIKPDPESAQDDLHDKSLSSGARIFPSRSRERLVVPLSVFISSRLCLSARFLRVTQNQTSIRCIRSFGSSQKIE
jgi:hypothetical protein